MKPDYYEDFTCIADRCSFTCCREWKIGVDEDTFVKWKHTLTPDGMYDTFTDLSAFSKRDPYL